MRPPACVSCKWGTGTTCEKQTNSVSTKELEAKLKQMMTERTNQDVQWFAPPVENKSTEQRIQERTQQTKQK